MEIRYKTKKLEKICTDASIARKEKGAEMAKKIFQRIAEIRAAENLAEMLRFKYGRFHPLSGDRQGQYAMDLVQPHRLVLEVVDGVCIACIIEIVDYH